MYTIGFDGLIRAGKSTLIKRLSTLLNAGVIDEYGKYVKRLGVGFPPFPPRSYEDAIHASRLFVEIEAQRVKDLNAYTACKIVLVDRTYLSCLAFDFAARHYSGFDTFCEVRTMWSENVRIECDTLFFLNVSDAHLQRRVLPHRDTFLPHFYDTKFNAYLTAFLNRECDTNVRMQRVNADKPIGVVDAEVLHHINQLHL